MSSPRKYASPYLSGIPGLPIPAANKTKKRSKTSITKISEVSVDADAGDTKSHAKNFLNNELSVGPPSQPPSYNYDASCGDMDQRVINDIISGTKSIALSSTSNEEEKNTEQHDGKDEKGLAADSASPNLTTSSGQNSEIEVKQDATNISASDEVVASPSLKSILKKPSIYKVKSKSKDLSGESAKKSTKSSKGKIGKTPKESSSRATSKHRIIGAASISASKTEVGKAPANLSSKSPRRRVKASSSKLEDTEDIPLLPKKSVRFSNKIEVHPVPYECRAGTRPCDWQRNMLEQRVQTFRQLMKDVGTDEIDLFGAGMLFPGYPYHVPNPNFALRGSRLRNFKL